MLKVGLGTQDPEVKSHSTDPASQAPATKMHLIMFFKIYVLERGRAEEQRERERISDALPA